MASFASRLKELRKAKGYTQQSLAKEISKYTDCSASAIGMYEQGRRKPDFEMLEIMADLFNVDVDFLVGDEDFTTIINLKTFEPEKISASQIIGDNFTPIPMQRSGFISIPVYGSVPAGVPVEAIENIDGSVDIPEEWERGGNRHFALKVKGDSMYPFYLEDDIVIIRKQSSCDSGSDAVVYVNGYDATLKTVIFNEDKTITLRPKNPMWKEQTYGPNDEPIQILGVVVESRRTIK